MKRTEVGNNFHIIREVDFTAMKDHGSNKFMNLKPSVDCSTLSHHSKLFKRD